MQKKHTDVHLSHIRHHYHKMLGPVVPKCTVDKTLLLYHGLLVEHISNVNSCRQCFSTVLVKVGTFMFSELGGDSLPIYEPVDIYWSDSQLSKII